MALGLISFNIFDVRVWFILLVYFSNTLNASANVTVNWEGGGPLCQVNNTICTGVGSIVMPSFACSDAGTDWSNGLKLFQDPTPPGSIIKTVTAVLYGAFGCDTFGPPPQVTLKIGAIVFTDLSDLSFSQCICRNCAAVVTLNASITYCDFPEYTHGGINSLQVLVSGNTVCLSSVVLVFDYVEAVPFAGTVTPNLGPSTGLTQVIVHGYDSQNSNDAVYCVFNETKIFAVVEQGTVQCTSPQLNASGVVPFYVTTFDGCLGRTTPNITYFQFYVPPIVTSVLPTNGPSGGGTIITIIGSSFFNSSLLGCKIGQNLGQVQFINETNILCTDPGGTESGQNVSLSFNGQQYFSTDFQFEYDTNKSFWNGNTTSWIILGVSGVAAVGLIILFIALIKSRFKHDGYDQIVEGKQITIDEVRLGTRVGKGNFGEVYKAYWRGAEIAVKKLPVHNMTDQFLKDFHKEVSLMRALRHPNVIQFLGSCTVVPDICICIEYMPRGSLYKILHEPSQTLTWALIKKMCIDAAKGCVYLHDCTPVIVHRDLKSHNLLVDENWKVKVCDFGLSTIVEQASRTMTACGTPCWTAPEVLRNQRYTEKADVYSFGVVLWECATREDPFVGMPPFQVIFAVGREGLRPPLPRVAPPDFIKLITDCWDEKPNTRPSMKEVLARLENIDTTGWPDIPIRNSISMSPSLPSMSNPSV